jgi:hypothetical protein
LAEVSHSELRDLRIPWEAMQPTSSPEGYMWMLGMRMVITLTMMVEVMFIVKVSLLSPAGEDDAAGGGTVDVRVTVTCIVL